MITDPMLPLLYKVIGHFAIFGTAAGGLLVADVHFRDQITLGSLLVGVLVVFIAGMFTIRSKIANIWREEAEGERAAKERLQEELNEMLVKNAEVAAEQQELRHNLKDQIAGMTAQLRVMEAKTDLTAALDAIKEIAEQQHNGHDETHRLLIEIRDKLPEMPLSISQPVQVELPEGPLDIKEPLRVHEVGEKEE